jgi:hypothetical protein
MPIPVAIAAASSIVSAGTSIVQAISGTSDAAKRRIYEQNLGLLSLDEKRKLERMLMEAGNDQARQQILASTLGTLGTARINALATVQAEKEKTKKTIIILSIVAGIVVIGGLFYVSKK